MSSCLLWEKAFVVFVFVIAYLIEQMGREKLSSLDLMCTAGTGVVQCLQVYTRLETWCLRTTTTLVQCMDITLHCREIHG